MVDKASSPINAIIEKQGALNKQINQTKRAMGDNASAQKMISDYQKIEAQVQKTANAIALDMAKAQEKITKLDERKAKSKTGELGARDATEYEQQQAKVTQLRHKLEQANRTLDEHKEKLKGAGINSNDLSGAMQKLTSEQDKNRASLEQLVKQSDRYKNGTVFGKINDKLSMGTLRNLATDVAVAGAAFSGLFVIMKGGIDEMDKIDDMAKKLGISAEKLQVLQYQGHFAGIEPDEMNSAIATLTTNLGKLQKAGDGKLFAYLKGAGMWKEFNQLKHAKDAVEAHGILLDAIAKQKNQQSKMALAKAAYGSASVNMMDMLNNGRKGLEDSQAEQKSLGAIVSSDDAAAAGDFNDALDKIIIAFKAIRNTVITPIMKEMTAAITDLTENLKNLDWREEKIKIFGDYIAGAWDKAKKLGDAFGWVIDHYQEIVAGFIAVKIALFGLNAVMLANPIGMFISAIGLLIVGIVYLMQKLDLLMPALEWLSEVAKRIGAGIVAVFGTIAQAALAMVEGVLSAMSMLPNKYGGDWAKEALKDVERVRKKISEATEDAGQFAFNGETEQAQMLRKQDSVFTSPLARSQSEVSVRILSDKPIAIDKATTTGNTDLTVDAGMLLGSVF
jgi:hypothetical protein